jgi:hypothetical protein
VEGVTAMSLPNNTSSGLGIDGARAQVEKSAEERLPVPQAALIITAQSLGLWVLIGYGLKLLLS